MGNIIKEFQYSIIPSAVLFVVGIVLIFTGILDFSLGIIVLVATGIYAISSTLFTIIYNTQIIKNPLFMKDTDMLKNVRLYTFDGDKLKLIDIINKVEFSDKKGFIKKHKLEVYVDDKDIIISPKYKTANILFVGEGKALTIGEIGLVEKDKHNLLLKNAIDENYYRNRIEKQVQNIKQAELEASKLSNDNKQSLFHQLIGSSMVLGISAMISIIMLILAMKYSSDLYTEATKSISTLNTLAESNKYLSQTIQKAENTQNIYIRTIAKELNIPLPEEPKPQQNTSSDKLKQILGIGG